MTNILRLSLGIAVTALLIGCNKADPAATNEANVANIAAVPANNAVTPAATPAAAAGVLSSDYMVGKWSAMDENCAETLEFRKDGTAATPFGEGKWSLAGDKLSMDFGEGTSTMDPSTIKVLSQDRIEISKGSGKKETQKRC